MFTQLVTPNLDPTINENGVLTDWLGWCLAYAKNAYSAFGPTGMTAWEAWTNTQFKHTEEVPTNVYIPIWFSGYNGMGHVSILYKRDDGQIQIWSSPISHKPYADVWGSIGEVERRYGVTYVGWSEDIAGVQVIKKGDDVMTEDGVRYGYLSVTMAQPTDEQVKYWVGRPSQEFELGMYTLSDNYVLNYYKQVQSLTAENTALKEQLAHPPTPPSNPDQVVITKDSLWAKFKKLIGA